MDIKDGVFEEFNQNTPSVCEDKQIKLPLPDEDFDENGKLKPLRKRVFKKLLRQEMKFYKPLLIIMLVCLLGVGLALSIFLRILAYTPMPLDGTDLTWIILPLALLYLYGLIGGSLFGLIYPVVRYNKNFFKGEGYLTFSIPASAEEHVFAKRLAAIFCQLVMTIAVILSLVMLVLIVGAGTEFVDFFSSLFALIGDLYTLEPVHAILFTVEALVFLLVITCVGPSLFGAASCFMSKQTERRKIATTVIIVFIVVGVVNSLLSMLIEIMLIPLLSSEVGVHIAIWIYLLINVGITVLCVLYEINFLKKKLDLK